MKKNIAIIICLIFGCVLTGCLAREKGLDKNTEKIDVNMDIRDCAVPINYETLKNEDLNGEKVIVEGIVADIDMDGIRSSTPNFILVQDQGENVEEYLIGCNMTVEEFKGLGIADGSAVKVYGIVDEISNGDNVIIRTSLLDKEL